MSSSLTNNNSLLPLKDQDLFSKLDELSISVSTIEHPPLRTVDDAQRLCGDLPGGHVKNLFLKDKHKRFWLLVALDDTTIDLKATATLLNAQKFSFASYVDLEKILGILPGSVSPLALINDRSGLVTLVLDERLVAVSPLNFHPLRNDRTTVISTTDFLAFLDNINHIPRIVRLPG